jgi:integrase
MKTGRITIWKTKNGKPRTIKMTGRVKNILERLAVGRNDFDTLVFKDHAEKRLYRDWWKMRDAIGLGDDAQFVLHMLRHTCATRLLGAGVDIRSAMEWLGHSSIEQTQRYAHFIPSKSDDAADALDRLAAEKLGGVMV